MPQHRENGSAEGKFGGRGEETGNVREEEMIPGEFASEETISSCRDRDLRDFDKRIERKLENLFPGR